MPVEIQYSPDALSHLGGLSARQRTILLDGVEAHLQHEPDIATRHRKRLRPNDLATWELRLGDLRVYYEMESSPVKRVMILAVGVKVRNELHIGGRRFKL